jgi:hypothetical protein
VTYLVSSGYMYDRRESFTNWLPALLTYLMRLRKNEARCGASVINRDLNDYDHDGLTEEQRGEVEEYGNV